MNPPRRSWLVAFGAVLHQAGAEEGARLLRVVAEDADDRDDHIARPV